MIDYRIRVLCGIYVSAILTGGFAESSSAPATLHQPWLVSVRIAAALVLLHSDLTRATRGPDRVGPVPCGMGAARPWVCGKASQELSRVPRSQL